MNFDGFGGLALAVVAGLWLMVFVPSWFKRAQDRENGVAFERPKAQKRSRKQASVHRVSVDNFSKLAREYAGVDVVADVVDERAWERTELPAPRANNGTLEVVSLAAVSSIEDARQAVVARKLEQHELDEILRRRRANA